MNNVQSNPGINLGVKETLSLDNEMHLILVIITVIRAINSQHMPPGYRKEYAFPTTKKSWG